VGANDPITPPAHAEFLKQALSPQTSIELHLDENAGHFTYMDELPPHVVDIQSDRKAFLSALAGDVARFFATQP
jgi:pimeloyl-ACP methyl ester carboxylesterase